MKILNLLIEDKKVAGVEISDSSVCVSYFSPRRKILGADKTLPKNELIFIEEELPVGVIIDGVIIDKIILGNILKKLWIKEGLSKMFAVVSIQEDKIYSHIFPIPKDSSNGSNLKQAISMAIEFELPFKRSDMNISWENASKTLDTKEILISSIPKKIIDDYTSVLDGAGVSVYAIESHIASLLRSINIKDNENILLVKNNQNSTTVFSIKNNILRFSRTMPSLFIKDEKNILDEISKIKNFLEFENGVNITELRLSNATIKEDYLIYPEISSNTTKQSKYLISMGALIRGEIPKGQDSDISLLDISTDEAYKYQKIKIFIYLIRNITIGISIFFIFAFIMSYFFIFSLSQNINSTSSNITILPASSNLMEKQQLIQNVNSLTLVSHDFLVMTPNWSIIVDEIYNKTIDGVTISSLNAPSPSENITLVGVARNRDVLNQFKKSLQGSTMFTDINLPILNLEQKSDIAFLITFKIINPSMIYYK